MSSELKVALAVIGAGLYGIQAARTYLEIHPDHDVVIFEASNYVGGVWSQERVYDEFWTQTPLGIAEFSDMPLKGIPVADQYYGFFPAKYVANYLEDYVRTRAYSGKSLKSRIKLSSKVLILARLRDGWRLKVKSVNGSVVHETDYYASKVIDATGLSSTSKMPSLPGREHFSGAIVHHLEFGKLEEKLLARGNYEDVVVVGGAKSAADMAYACAKAGKRVSWIIRKDGAGPAAFVSAKSSAMYKNSNESFYTRFTSHFLASLYFDESQTILGRFLYHTRLGQWLLRFVWAKIDAKTRKLADYDRLDGRVNQYHKLKPDTPLFWQNDSTGICQRDDFFDVIANRVTVYREDIVSVTESGVILADMTEVRGNAILCGTGWKSSHPSIVNEDGESIEHELGLAGYIHPTASEIPSDWDDLELTAADEIRYRFPILQDTPVQAKHAGKAAAPLKLYKGIIPINDRPIAFVGQLLLGNNFRVAEVQALFAVAALDEKFQLPPADEMRQDIARHLAWSRLRYLKKGEQGNWLYWDMVPYTDHLLDFLGLHSHRPRGWYANLFATCFASELRGVIEEYKDNFGSESSSDGK